MKGRLGKLGSKVTKFKAWKKRWFVLHPSNKLYYMKSLEVSRITHFLCPSDELTFLFISAHRINGLSG